VRDVVPGILTGLEVGGTCCSVLIRCLILIGSGSVARIRWWWWWCSIFLGWRRWQLVWRRRRWYVMTVVRHADVKSVKYG
jgi:hypothetical protein